MKRLLFLILIFPAMQGFGQRPQILWQFSIKAPAFGQAAVADIDGDGKPEIVFSTYMNDGNVYALNAEDGSKLWSYQTGGCNDAAPIIADVNGDGYPEVIVASSCVAKTFCLRGSDGHKLWATLTGGTDSPPTIGDIDRDGKPEILHGQFDGSVICMNGEDGSVKWTKMVDDSASIQTSAALLDADGDGQLDFVVANWNYYNHNHIWAFRGDTRSQIWRSDVPGDVIYHGGSFADIDGDGKPELVFGCYDDHVYCLNAEDGSLKWAFDMGAYNYVGGPVVLADINNDGHYEILAAGWYQMKAISDSGTEVWSYNIPDYASCFRGPAIADINNDGYLDLLFGTSSGKVIALSGPTGDTLWTMDLQALYGDTLDIDFAPVIADFNGDGLLEGFVVGGYTGYPNISNDYGRGYAFSLGSCVRPALTMFQHDSVRSSHVPLDWPTSVPVTETGFPDITIFPNPVHDRFTLQFNPAERTLLRVDLLSADGIRIARLFDRVISKEAFSETFDLSGTNFPEGIYLLQIRTNDKQRTVKLIRI